MDGEVLRIFPGSARVGAWDMESQVVMDITLSSRVKDASLASAAEPGCHHRCERTGTSGSTEYTADDLLRLIITARPREGRPGFGGPWRELPKGWSDSS